MVLIIGEYYSGPGAVRIFDYNDVEEEWQQFGYTYFGENEVYIGSSVTINDTGNIITFIRRSRYNSTGNEYGNYVKVYELFDEDIHQKIIPNLNVRISYRKIQIM